MKCLLKWAGSRVQDTALPIGTGPSPLLQVLSQKVLEHLPGGAGGSHLPSQPPGCIWAPCAPPGTLAGGSNIAPVLTAGPGQCWPPFTALPIQAEFKSLGWIWLVLVLGHLGLAAGCASLGSCLCVLEGGWADPSSQGSAHCFAQEWHQMLRKPDRAWVRCRCYRMMP